MDMLATVKRMSTVTGVSAAILFLVSAASSLVSIFTTGGHQGFLGSFQPLVVVTACALSAFTFAMLGVLLLRARRRTTRH